MRGSARQWSRTLGGPALTLALLATVEVARGTLLGLRVPVPGSVLAPALVTMVYATFVGGRASGLASALLTVAYAAWGLWPQPSLAGYGLRLGVLVISSFALVLLVDTLRVRADVALESERRQATALARTNEELSRTNETLEAFAYVTAHDLKEPVRAIDDNLATLATHPLPEPARAEVAAAQAHTRRLAKLLQGLLEYSRASMTMNDPEPLRIDEIVRSDACAAQYAPLLARRDGILEIDPDIRPVQGSQTGLAQVFGNLILNAIRHNPREAPLVRIRRGPEESPDVVHVIVEDNGPGFPPATIRRFESLRSDRPSSVGGGFGLAIARRALDRMGARMRLETTPGGACAHLHLRAAHASETTPRTVPVEGPPAAAPLPPEAMP